MPKVAVYNTEGQEIGELELSDRVFGAKINPAVMHSVVVMQMANRRRGTASTKTRAEVRGGGRKPWRQKGTGRARVGSIRSPLWRTGGITFGPKPRNFRYRVPKKVRQLALKSALSAKVKEGNLIVLDNLAFAEPKTKAMVQILNSLKVNRKALVVTADANNNVQKSARNIPGILPLEASGLNVYDLLKHDHLIMTKEAVARVEEVLV
ncbi:MAG TPA: 50S ribosomal protein L4 [Clostridia bacterium]|nr:50S ribosomal protein L4 [Clostridia bacterium]